jgi:hypothetical protein
MGRAEADESFTAWLLRNSRQLGALTLGSYGSSTGLTPMLQALADAAEAAVAAGAPLPLHTLRVFGRQPGSNTIDVAGRLLACLPCLRCLQLELGHQDDTEASAARLTLELLEACAPLKQASQLQELHLTGPVHMDKQVFSAVAGLLPLTLRRLSWRGAGYVAAPDLSHLTQATFLHLYHWARVTSAKLPPTLQQLELSHIPGPLDGFKEQEQVVTEWHTGSFSNVEQQLDCLRLGLPRLRQVGLGVSCLSMPAAGTALAQNTGLSGLALIVVGGDPKHMPSALAAAGSLSNLRSLQLHLVNPPPPTGLSALKQVTKLVTRMSGDAGTLAKRRGWAEEIGRMAGLQWLSVPDGLLGAGWGPLAGLQQLRVLVVHCVGFSAEITSAMELLLEEWGQHGLPPRLQVLCVHGLSADQAATKQFRRLRQLLRGSGCEVVVGVDLDEVCDPAQQLAGLPVALQQVLA